MADEGYFPVSDLNSIEQWILDPISFDYSQFNAVWIVATGKSWLLDLIKGKQEVIQAVEQSLRKNYNPKLAEIYYQRLLI